MFMKMLQRMCSVACCGALALFFLLSGCSNEGKAKESSRRDQVVVVAVGQVKQQDVPVALSVVGNVEASSTVEVRSRVGGMIVRQFVRDGQEVRKGEALFLIDPRPFELAVREARARLDRDRATLEKAEDDVRRFQLLKEQGVVSQENYEQALSQAKALRASVRLDEAELDTAKLDLEYATLRSPMEGNVGRVLVEEGNVVKANDDRVLVVVHRVRPVLLSFAVPERYFSDLRRAMAGGKVLVSAYAEGRTTGEKGILESMDNAVDKTTGTIRLQARFENREGVLWPGQFAKVEVELSSLKNALVVPAEAVQTGVKGDYVYVLKADNTSEMRPVQAGVQFEGIRVVDQGVVAGETVITEGHIRLFPGAKAEVRKPEPKKTQTSPKSDKPGAAQ